MGIAADFAVAEEMGKLYTKYGGDDLDIAAMYAESLMVLKPWALWVKDETSGDVVPADTNTLLVKQILTKVRCTTKSGSCRFSLVSGVHALHVRCTRIVLPEIDGIFRLERSHVLSQRDFIDDGSPVSNETVTISMQ